MTLSRRDFLRSGGVAAGAMALGTGTASAQTSFGGWMADAN
ncbi:MAG: twin-arginine translocation signal domain-containing protein, partial [Halobacteriaceae archaeon]